MMDINGRKGVTSGGPETEGLRVAISTDGETDGKLSEVSYTDLLRNQILLLSDLDTESSHKNRIDLLMRMLNSAEEMRGLIMTEPRQYASQIEQVEQGIINLAREMGVELEELEEKRVTSAE